MKSRATSFFSVFGRWTLKNCSNCRTVYTSMPFSLAAVILAAGRSVRMGQPKLLLPWGGRSIIGHLLAQWRDLKAQQITVVCAGGDMNIQEELDRLGFPTGDRI